MLEPHAEIFSAGNAVFAKRKSLAFAIHARVADITKPPFTGRPVRQGGVYTALGLTIVEGARISIVAAHNATDAFATDTCPGGLASFVVRARPTVWNKGAGARAGITGIIGTGVSVVACDGRTRAYAIAADIPIRAPIPVIAELVDGGEGTTRGIAGIARADISVIAVQRLALTLPPKAFVRERAGVPIVAPDRVGLEDAPTLRFAAVVRTHVPVIAGRRPIRNANHIGADISGRAIIAVIAGHSIGLIDEDAIPC